MSDLKHDSHIQILLVEDTRGDTRLIKEAFHHLGKPLKLHHAWHGAEALEFLRRKNPFGAAPRPDLILLDLDIPEMDGREVLAQINADPHLKSIPTIILAAFRRPSRCFALLQAPRELLLGKAYELGGVRLSCDEHR